MSNTAVIETHPETVTELVKQITRRRALLNAQNKKHDEQLTEVIINDTPGMRRGKHRAEPIEAALYLGQDGTGRHRALPFTSLHDLIK